MDPMTAILMTFGVILILTGWVQLLLTSFKEDYNWGLVTLFLPPLSYLYACCNWQQGKGAMILTFLGWLLVLLGL